MQMVNDAARKINFRALKRLGLGIIIKKSFVK
jgi:hypothetical protein